MYAIYRELHPPTGIEHCLECNFLDDKQKNLVVAATSVLRVFNLVKANAVETESPKSWRLVQVGEHRLYGNIQSLEKVRLGHTHRDTLLLTFKDAKLSLVEYDSEVNDLKVVSLHLFEDDDIRGGITHNICRPYARVDPDGRCAAMLVYGTHLAVLPFRQSAVIEEAPVDTPLTPGADKHDIDHSFTVDLHGLSERVMGVRDFQFIHGYNNPTVFILYEPTPTWAGRITLRKDTCSIVALSLNLSQQTSPVIWHLHNIPFDSCYCVPVPRPIGGMLIVGANTLLYMNQSSPSVGVSLSSITDSTTNFGLRLQSSTPLSMDCSNAVFISSDHVVVSLKGGDIYILTLVPDGMRGIRNIIFEKAASGVITSCICVLDKEFIFLGSRLGNSLLLRCTQTEAGTNGNDGPPPEKKRKSEDVLDPDELEVYGQDTSGPLLKSFLFEVCDSILNIGPIKNCTLGEPGFLSEEFVKPSEQDLELVTCSGHGKNGALCVLQMGVRPQVVTTFELPGCRDMWTVLSRQEDGSCNEHGFLILSQKDSTMVLQTGKEITELDSSGFSTQSPTVYAGNMADKECIVQVTTTDIRLLRGVNQLCRVALDMGGGVKSCDVTDPYAVILLVDGTVGIIELQYEGDLDPSLHLSWPELPKGSKVTSISTYTDTSGLFLTVSKGTGSSQVGHTHLATPTTPARTKTTPKRSTKVNIDDEDELLYGDISALTAAVKKQSHESTEMDVDNIPDNKESEATPTHWVVLCREEGSLEFYKVPTFELVFCVRNFSSAPKTLMDSGPISLSSSLSGGAKPVSTEQSVSEILMTGAHPHLIALIDKEVVIYRAFHYQQVQSTSHLQLRFSKVQHEILLHDRKAEKVTRQLSQQEDEEESSKVKTRLRVFKDISGYSGVFVCGLYPHWLFMTPQGPLTVHPMSVDGPVLSFAPFNNVNCPRGFLYFNAEGELRISVLPSHLTYDSTWLVRKVPTRCTVHYVSYHMESKTHAVVTSDPSPVREIPTGDEPDQIEGIEKDERFVFPMEDNFHIQLYSPLSWEPVPNTRYSLERFDRVVSMKVMRLRSQETVSGRKEYIVLGATSVAGEDIQCKGKIMIFDVIEVIPEPGKPLTKHKLKCLYNQEQKGTISALEAVDGLILACMGQRIFMWHFKDNKDLLGVAFIDTDIYIHTAVALKSFILIGDVSHSVQLLRYKESLRTLSLISRDPHPSEIYACNFVVDGQQLGFLASDSDQNLIMYQYQPELPETSGGLYLTRRGDFNAGAHINVFLRAHCRSAAPPGATSEVKALMAEKRDITFFATLDGGIGYVLPVAEKTYRRLLVLQSKLVQGLSHNAGLNPKAFRMYNSHYQYLYSHQRNILDGELLWRYPQLSSKEKMDFAKQIGTTREQILEDLKEIDKISTQF